jgi:hypothetical protein
MRRRGKLAPAASKMRILLDKEHNSNAGAAAIM